MDWLGIADLLQAIGSLGSWYDVGQGIQQRQLSAVLHQASERYNSITASFPSLRPDQVKSDVLYQELLDRAERISPGTSDLLD